jgi:isoleucyl-tRNA synthetase
MSKRLKNYPDPEIVVDTHGADALRMVSAAMRANCVWYMLACIYTQYATRTWTFS